MANIAGIRGRSRIILALEALNMTSEMDETAELVDEMFIDGTGLYELDTREQNENALAMANSTSKYLVLGDTRIESKVTRLSCGQLCI